MRQANIMQAMVSIYLLSKAVPPAIKDMRLQLVRAYTAGGTAY